MPTFRESSRQDWDSSRTTEHINAGSLQRIAAATEAMAVNHVQLQLELKEARASWDYWQSEAVNLKHKLAGARGSITKLRKRLAYGYQPEPSPGPTAPPPVKP